jgi:hypothetical protein
MEHFSESISNLRATIHLGQQILWSTAGAPCASHRHVAPLGTGRLEPLLVAHHYKAGSSGRQAVSQSHTSHVSFLSPSCPPALQQQATTSSPEPHQHQAHPCSRSESAPPF